MKDAIATMGGLLPEGTGGRDAVHVAVFSAISNQDLLPSQQVAIEGKDQNGDTVVSSQGEVIGIVDPFISGSVPHGSRFWVYLFPRTITSLLHLWTHPAFEETDGVYATPNDRAKSEAWLRDFCDTADCPSYTQVMAKAELIADDMNDAFDDEYMYFSGSDAHGDIPDEFWDHVEVVLGRPIRGQRAKYFTCSC